MQDQKVMRKTDLQLREALHKQKIGDDQIKKLEMVRGFYPHLEFASSRREWAWLKFMRDQFKKGILNEGR